MRNDKTALLVIDVQDSFKRGPRWARRSNPFFERNVAALVDSFRAAHDPVIFIMHTDPEEGFRVGDPEFRLMSFLERRDGEPLLVKTTRNSFTSTDLQQRLDALGIERLVITGIQTEQCCETTARIGADLGYEVDFVTDATLTFPIVHNGDEYSTDEIIRRTEFVLRNRFARIVTTGELTEALSAA